MGAGCSGVERVTLEHLGMGKPLQRGGLLKGFGCFGGVAGYWCVPILFLRRSLTGSNSRMNAFIVLPVVTISLYSSPLYGVAG